MLRELGEIVRARARGKTSLREVILPSAARKDGEEVGHVLRELSEEANVRIVIQDVE